VTSREERPRYASSNEYDGDVLGSGDDDDDDGFAAVEDVVAKSLDLAVVTAGFE
jgi:hypothetical protein